MTVKNIRADNIGVDAGLIMVADISYLDNVPSPDKKELNRLGKIFDISNGDYEVHWRIPETWNGDVSGFDDLRVTSGKIFVCDPCYCIGKSEHKDWMKWLEDTDYGDSINNESAFIISSMGGDGCYEVRLELREKWID